MHTLGGMARAEQVANHLGALAVAVASAQRGATEGMGTDSRVAALLTLREFPGSSVGELAAVLDLTHSACVRIIDGLASEGLVRRARGGADARRVALALTAPGARAADRLQAARLRALARLLEPLDAGERARLGALLDTLLRGSPRERLDARRICRFCAHSICRGPACPVGGSVAPC